MLTRIINCALITYLLIVIFFFFNDTATTEIYTLSLHDALPIYDQVVDRQPDGAAPVRVASVHGGRRLGGLVVDGGAGQVGQDRKSTRLNSSHVEISYAVFCLKKKKIN